MVFSATAFLNNSISLCDATDQVIVEFRRKLLCKNPVMNDMAIEYEVRENVANGALMEWRSV